MSAVPESILAPADTLTVLHSADNKRLAKRWEADGSITDHDKGYLFTFTEHPVSGIHELSALLSSLESDPFACIIRGRFVGEGAAQEEYARLKDTRRLPAGKHRRLGAIFKDQPLRYLLGDIDGYVPEGLDPVNQPVACIEQYIAKKLPACFQGVSYHWALSGSAGHARSAGKLKAHVTFCLSKAYTGDELDAWNESLGGPLDGSVFNSVQINYTAAPLFASGAVDPVPTRSGFVEGWSGDSVDLHIGAGTLLRARGVRKSRAEMADPRDKENQVGLFCRTFEIEEVVDRWLSEVFVFIDEDRLTFLQSDSGTPGGGRVTDNRQGIYNSHNSDPFHNRAANKWDLVRHYVFGHLDAGLDDFERMDVWSLPSHKAMCEMVETLPEMQEETINSADTHRAALSAAADEAGVRSVAQRIALDSTLDRLARDTLAGVIQNRMREITGVRPRIDTVRAMVTLGRTGQPGAVDAPDWAAPWCYVTSAAKFLNRDTKELMTREAFDAAHCRNMPVDDEGNRPSAARVACDEWAIPTVYETMYLPSAGDVFTIDGREYANTYRPDLVPTSAVDQAAFDVLQRHIDLLVPNPGYRAKLLQWMAWVVRNPGKKVIWAILIKGVEGDGKSILGSMLGQAMGFANVGIISPDTLAGSSFNDWAVGRCVNVIEELKLQGHNRHDVYNKIKPLITNERIELHGKGKAATTAVNTTNYLAFSNHADAIPLDDKDRRQFVLFTPWLNIDEMHKAIEALGLTAEKYWDALWEVVKNRPDAVRGYFESIDLTGFDPKSRAPATSFKDAVVAAGDLDDAEAIAKAVIEQGGIGVNKNAVSSACLTNLLATMSPPITLHTTRVRKLLVALGFESISGLVWWNGAPHRVWVPRLSSHLTNADPDKVRDLLNQADADVEEDFLK